MTSLNVKKVQVFVNRQQTLMVSLAYIISSFKMAYVGKGGQKTCEHAVKNTYQAIVLTDSFDEKFQPLSKDNFTVLFPLVNQPILEYTLRFLKSSGIETVYLVCCKNADAIQDYLNQSGWLNPFNEMQISVIVSYECMSLGDTLREIDSRGVIRNDFVLVNQCLVSNIDLQPIINEHRETYKTNKQLLMTEVYTRVLPKHRCRSVHQETVLLIDGNSKRILYHQKNCNKQKISFPLSIFQENSHLSVRFDLSGSHISICSPQVLSSFSDNFDYQTKDDFIKGILENEEILGNTIHAHVANDEYACSIVDFQTYDAVSKDIIDRWVYPFAPDINFQPSKLGYSYLRQNVYLSKDVVLPRSCNLKNKLIIGEGTRIGTGLFISQSVIGKNCVIGNNVTIEDSHIWDNVKIDEGCVLKSAVIAHNVHLLENVQISPGCILSYNVTVGPSCTISEGTILVDKAPTDEFGEQISVPNTGEKGCAFVYQTSDMKSYLHYVNGLLNVIEDEVPSSVNVSDAEASDEDFDDNVLAEDSNLFYKEIVDSLKRAVEEKIPSENLILEINSSKYAYNVSMKEVNNLLTLAILDIPNSRSSDMLDVQQYFTILQPVLNQMETLFQNYMKSPASQMDCLFAMEEYFARHRNYMQVTKKIMFRFYNSQILSEEAILKWYNTTSDGSEDGTAHQLIRNNVIQFIDWLKNAEEESEDEDEDEESD